MVRSSLVVSMLGVFVGSSRLEVVPGRILLVVGRLLEEELVVEESLLLLLPLLRRLVLLGVLVPSVEFVVGFVQLVLVALA